MANVPATVTKRLIEQVPRYQKVLNEAKERDNGRGDNEANTGKIVVNMLSDVFGFDKFKDIDKEYEIDGGDRCDVAVKIEGKVRYLIEIKAIRINLKENHIKQVEAYGFRAGIRWVVLTNGVDWQVYRIGQEGKRGAKKLTREQVCTFDFLDMKAKNPKHHETLFLLCKRGVNKALFEELYERQQVVNEHTIAALMMSEEVQKIIVRELKKLEQNAKPDKKEIAAIIEQIIIPSFLVDNEKTKKAIAKIKKRMQKKPNEEKAAAAQD